ncbi:MAG: hypothetical protein HYZ37_08865 [Candidatus Solibacter usitatus]|nr:hypothetical protein [Candidatus Solibacter usitatus]
MEEAYPIAAALEMLRGKVLYRDIWFDKPPLFPAFYATFGAAVGWKLRLAGSLLVSFSSVTAFWLARRLWSSKEGFWAAGLLAFFLTFGIPSAVLAVAPDMLMIAPHLLALLFCVRKQPLFAGVASGIAMLINAKGAFVLAACIAWDWRSAQWILLGAAAAQLPVLSWMAWQGSLRAYWDQVWVWGFSYSADPPFDSPASEGVRRTMNWLGFQLGIVFAAAAALMNLKKPLQRSALFWLAISFVAVMAGWRFFPRYYFHLLTPMCIFAARGICTMGKARFVTFALMLIPLIRFSPGYVERARGLPTIDLALHDDAVRAVEIVKTLKPKSIMVWGYRPEIYAYSRIPAGTPFLDSQPLTGVLADRHLTQVKPTFPALAKENRRKLTTYWPEVIVDGLAPMNLQLGLGYYPDLQDWRNYYVGVTRIENCAIYVLRNRERP